MTELSSQNAQKNQPVRGLKRIINALQYSWQGYKACLREEAFRQEMFLAALMIPLAFWISDTAVECSVLIGSIALVLIVELLNTAIERAIDRISFERHELSKDAKDMGSAAVLTSLLFAGIIWSMIILPKLF